MIKHLSIHCCCLAIIFLLAGCVSHGPTKPNTIYAGDYPQCLRMIEQNNSRLFTEIGKLPEIQDGIDIKEEAALEKLCEAYRLEGPSFDHAFSEMYQTGLPGVRKYCTPLQALFWLAHDYGTAKVVGIVPGYSLDNILSAAWKFKSAPLTDTELSLIISSISDQKLKAQYLRNTESESNETLQKHLLIDLRLKGSVFSGDAKNILRRKIHDKNPRWQDFRTTVERLNSPELVDYYERAQVQWVDWRDLPTWPVSPNYVFSYGKGDCTAIANFTALCLTRAGYLAFEFKIAPRRPVDNHHSICIFFDKEKKYAMDNGSPVQKGIYLFDR